MGCKPGGAHAKGRNGGGPVRQVLVGFAALLVACVAAAQVERRVEVPLRLDHAFVQQAVVQQVYGSQPGKVTIWDDGTGCAYVRLWDPVVSSAGERLRIVTRGEARLGTAIGSVCVSPVAWDGFLELLEAPRTDAGGDAIAFTIADSHVYDLDWKKPLLSGRLWDLVKDRVHPRFSEVRIDVGGPLRDLRALLPMWVAGRDTLQVRRMLDSVQLGSVGVTDAGLAATIVFVVAPPPAASPSPSEPALTPEELQHLDEALQRWDAFLTFVVKVFGRDRPVPEFHEALRTTLIEARYDLVEALAPSAPATYDPTPALFLKTWERLAPVLRNAAATQPSTAGLRYLSFITAADALAALQQLGPGMGVEISADGLRRLARIVAPTASEDPLAYSIEVDPELREVFGFGPPLPAPEIPADADDSQSWWKPGWFARPALAGETPPPDTVSGWLPSAERIDDYLRAVRTVLEEATNATLARQALGEPYVDLYRHLVVATAWQESCWRQFVRSGGRATYIRSPVGAVGLMQINERVWRGLYDLRGLRWDIRYNARAGSEILQHYLRDYAIARREHEQPGGRDNLARATYAVYNGGPGHLTRYRKGKTSKELRHIDRVFWEKYSAVTAGRESEVRRCLVGG